MENELNLEVMDNTSADAEVIKFYLNDEHFTEIKVFLENEDYAMAKDATKGLYLLAMELRLFKLYETLLDIYDDLEAEFYKDVIGHYEDMYAEYLRLKGVYENV